MLFRSENFMRKDLMANYNTKKMIANYLLKINNFDFIEDENIVNNNSLLNSIIESIDNDEYDNNELNNFCFSFNNFKSCIDDYAEICDNLGLSYFFLYEEENSYFKINSSDGIFKTEYESDTINGNDCTGIFKEFLGPNLISTIDKIREMIPNDGEYDLIMICE